MGVNASLSMLDEPGGEPVVTTPGWFVVPADDPDHHVHVDAPALEAGIADADLAQATHEAMDAATRLVADYLNQSRRS